MTSSSRVIAGRYRLESPIGRGGMGTVWRARDQLLQRTVAIKQIRPSLGVDPEVETREARLAAQLRHPNAVAIHDLITAGGDLWLIMEYVDGPSLSTLLKEGPQPAARLARLGAQIASALAAAHAIGIVHRDVKPGNILLSSTDEALLSDFGIARGDGDPHVTEEGFITGTPAYLAPEVVRGQSAGPAADAWGLGATLYHAVEGRLPFGDGPTLVLLQRIGNGQRSPMRAAGPLTAVIDGLMAPDPQRRLTTVQAVDHLDDVLRRMSLQPLGRQRLQAAETVRALPAPRAIPPVPGTTPQESTASRRAPWWALAAVAVLMLAVGYGLRWVIEPGPETQAGGSEVSQSEAASSGGSDGSRGSDGSGSSGSALTPGEQAEEVVTAVLVDALDDPEAAWELIAPELQQKLTGGYEGYLQFWDEVDSAELDTLHCTDELVCAISWTKFYKGGGYGTTQTSVLVGDTPDGMLMTQASATLFT